MVQRESGVVGPVGKEARHLEGIFPQPFLRNFGAALDPDDVVGVDVGARVVRGNGGERGEFFHGYLIMPRTSAISPAIAAAAAIAGLARCVRDSGPWRPTKLRLEVE